MSYTAYAENSSHSGIAPDYQATLADYVGRGGEDERSFDDLFDGPAYRQAQTTFLGAGHRLKPRGMTYYRPGVVTDAQGLPASAGSAHWAFLPPDLNQRNHNLNSVYHVGGFPPWHHPTKSRARPLPANRNHNLGSVFHAPPPSAPYGSAPRVAPRPLPTSRNHNLGSVFHFVG